MRDAFRLTVLAAAAALLCVAAASAQTSAPPAESKAPAAKKAAPPAGAPAAPKDLTKRALDAAPQVDTYRQCVNDWDAGTHIEKARWAEICRERTSAAKAGRTK